MGQFKADSKKSKNNYCEILKSCDYVKNELDVERDRFKFCTSSGKGVHYIMKNQSMYQFACLG